MIQLHVCLVVCTVAVTNKLEQWQIKDFPGWAQTPKVCVLNFCRKLHENERIWTLGVRPWHPLGSANVEVNPQG